MNANKARIFVSYSHRGDGPKWKARLVRHLGVFEQHHLLDVWQDGRIRVSSQWHDDIQQAMSDARLAVVLLTPEVLESEYILNTEFPFLRERQQRDKLPVFPVVCEECNWKAHDWLRATQAPNESNPLSQLSGAAQDRVFRKLATDMAEELSCAALAELPKPDQSSPSDHIYVDKFPLTSDGGQAEKLIGREQELALLDLAFAQPHTAIVSLVAWGGVGKTMLIQHWLQRLHRDSWFGARRVYGWSFYSQGTREDRQASEDTFLAHALVWFGVQCEPTLSPWDKGRLLADAVAREPTLLVLDGIEPLQYPPGPMGGQLRAPGVQSLLKRLAHKANNTEHPGLSLLTTREPLTDLIDFQCRPDAAWGSVLRVDLGNLTEEAGAALLHHAGAKRAGAAKIKADDAELVAASHEVDGHALTLSLLGRFLARAHGGDIRRRDLVKFEEADRKEQGGTTFKMLAAFEDWFAKSGEFGARQLAILRIVGLFDRPADAGCIGALRKPPAIDGLTDPLFTTRLDSSTGQSTLQPVPEEDWNTATSFLADFGLVGIQTDADNTERLLDCHPLIREHFSVKCRQDPESWRSTHRRLYEYLKQRCEYQPDTIKGLQPLYEAVTHGCRGQLHSEACEHVFLSRIRRAENRYENPYSLQLLGAVSDDLSALACFFEKPWSRLAPELAERLTENGQGFFLHESAYCLRCLGRLSEALEPMRLGLTLFIRAEQWKRAAQAANNITELETLLGDIVGAVSSGKKGVAYAERSDDLREKMCELARYAEAVGSAGDEDTALNLFREAEELQARRQPFYPLLYSLQGFLFCESLLALPERTAWQAEMTRSRVAGSRIAPEVKERCREIEERLDRLIKWRKPDDSLLSVALEELASCRVALYRGILQAPTSDQCASPHLNLRVTRAVDGLRNSRDSAHLPRGLLTRAWLCFLEGDAAGAQADLDEAWDIAERGPMRLHLADIHLHRARLFFREKRYPWKSARDDLADAEKLIKECGYRRRDEELADAKNILGPYG